MRWHKTVPALLAAAWAGLPSHAATFHASDSLQDALQRARDGDTIIASGPTVFRGPLVITKSVSLVGTNHPVIDGNGVGTAITVNASNVVLHGFVIRNSGADLSTLDAAIRINGPAAAVTGCVLETDGFGIYLRGASGCQIEGNTLQGDPAWPPSKRGNGIHLWRTRNNRILNNQIKDKRDGMYFSFADANEISGNQIERTRFGIHYMYSHYNRLLSNSLTGNAVGATLMFSQFSLVQGNRAVANLRHGMLFKQLDNSKVMGNAVIGHNRGFFVQQAAMNRFEGNIIATNDIGLYLSNGSEQNVFVGNFFINNADQIWQPPFEQGQGARGPNDFSEGTHGNYWSDYTGTDAEGDGIGDVPYHETDVYGYLVDRYPEARLFALSPAIAFLRRTEKLLPVLDLAGVTDLFPLMRPSSAGSASHPP